jgi:hypothetical protein
MPPARKVEAAPAVDRRDPLLRYQLITVTSDSGVWKAFIKDLLVNDSRFVGIGEKIGGCKLLVIAADKMSVRLKPSSGPEFTVKRGQPAR